MKAQCKINAPDEWRMKSMTGEDAWISKSEAERVHDNDLNCICGVEPTFQPERTDERHNTLSTNLTELERWSIPRCDYATHPAINLSGHTYWTKPPILGNNEQKPDKGIYL
jgi:hypothetical protein